jgi:membrane-associated protein
MPFVTDFLAWLHTLPQPALVCMTSVMMLIECTIGIGIFAPGEATLLVASTTATTAPRFLILWAAVTVCVVIGDSVGYAIGKRWGPRLRETKMIQRYGHKAWDKATDILRRRGAWAVFAARFLPTVRNLAPAAAGTAGLPFRKFLPAVTAGAVGWAGEEEGRPGRADRGGLSRWGPSPGTNDRRPGGPTGRGRT